jgi:hypothetical protein
MRMDVGLSIEEIANPYMYAKNSPIRYQDPTGMMSSNEIMQMAQQAGAAAPYVLGGLVLYAIVTSPEFREDVKNVGIELWTQTKILMTKTGELINKVILASDSNSGEIPEEDKDDIATHSHNQGHGNEWDLNEPDAAGIKRRIDDVLGNPDTQVGKRKNKDGTTSTGYLDPSDGTIVIHNPSQTNPDKKGTVFKPDYPKDYFNREFPRARGPR